MIALLALSLAAGAHGDVAGERPAVDASSTRAEVDGEGFALLPATARSEGFGVLAELTWLRAPLRVEYEDGHREALVRDLVELSLGARWDLDRLRLTARAPAILRATSDVYAPASGLGDARLDARFLLLSPVQRGLGLGLSAGLGLPLGARELSLGAPSPTGTGGVFGKLLLPAVELGALAAVELRARDGGEALVQDDRLHLRAGLQAPAWRGGGVALEIDAATELRAPWGPEGSHPAELLVGAHHQGPRGPHVRALIGTAISAGVGAPGLRVQLGLGHDQREPLDPR